MYACIHALEQCIQLLPGTALMSQGWPLPEISISDKFAPLIETEKYGSNTSKIDSN
jgi:hypothetical protein